MSPVHLFRTALVALSSPKTFSTGVFMQRQPHPHPHQQHPGGSSSQTPAPPDAKAWRAHHQVVFVDASGWLNLGAGVSRAALAAARACARRSLALLNAGTPEGFDAVFLTGRALAELYDYWYHVHLGDREEELGQPAAAAAEALDGDLPSWRASEQRVESLAAAALGSRAALVRVVRRRPTAHVHPRKGAAPPERAHVLLGVQADAGAALRLVDMGPPADQAAAAKKFRELWGDKSELRRFQDGAICEAVVWDVGAAGRHTIPDLAVSHVLARHLPPGASVACYSSSLDGALVRRRSSPDADAAAQRCCETATERLCKQLRALEGGSLRVVATQPLGAVSRHAAAFPPLPHRLAGAPEDVLTSDHLARCLEPVEVLCQLEGSGRWPENLEAYAKTKAALGCELASLVQQSYGLGASAAEGYVDVLSDGFAFRLRLATERDEAQQLKALAIRQAVEGPGARTPAREDVPLLTWHQGAVAAVAGAAPAFEPTVRLAKRWVGAHLLSPHLNEEAVELVVLALFAGAAAPARATTALAASRAGGGAGDAGGAAAPPASRLAGFLRFLRLLGEHPWRVQPLVVDPLAELSKGQRDAMLRAHASGREAGAAAPMCLCTPRDAAGGAWTEGRPSAQLLHRVAVLARRSAAQLERLLVPTGEAPAGEAAAAGAAAAAAAAIFTRDAGEYDAVIHLRRDALPNADRDLRLAGSSSGRRAAAGGGGGGSELYVAAAEALRREAEASTTKHSRAVLKGIPLSVLQARGARAVQRELLVGFDPLPIYLELLEQRFGDLAVFCSDFVGGDLVGVKWRPAGLAALPTRQLAQQAQRAEEAQAPGTAGRKKGGKKRAVDGQQQANGAAGSDGAAALAGGACRSRELRTLQVELLLDMVRLGAGLVERVDPSWLTSL